MYILFVIFLVAMIKAILSWSVIKFEQPKSLQSFRQYLLRMYRGASYDEINMIAVQLLLLFFPFSYLRLTSERSKSLVIVVGFLSILNLILLLVLFLFETDLWL